MIRLFLLAAALLFAGPAPAFALSTFSVTPSSWTDLGAGPMHVETKGFVNVYVYAGASPPSDLSLAHLLGAASGAGAPVEDFTSTAHVFAMAPPAWRWPVEVVTTPISPAAADTTAAATNAALGAPADSAWSGMGAGAIGPVIKYEAAKAEAIRALLAGTLFVDGSGHVQPVFAASLPLPAGAATAAKQPTLDGDGGAPAHVTNFPATQPVAQADVRGSGTLNAATSNAAYQIALNNGEGVVSFAVTGLTASGATLAIEASDDGGTTWAAVNGIVPATGVLFSMLTADQQFRVNSGGRTNVRLRVSATGTGTVTVASNASTASSAVILSSPVPAGGNVIGKVGADPSNPVSPAISIRVALTVQNAAYAAGNSLGGLQTIAAARVAGGGGMIVGVDWRSAGGSTNQVYVYAWTTSPAATCSDKVAFAENAADIAHRIPGFPLSLTPASPGSWDTVTRAAAANMSSAFTNADATPSANIYLCVVTAASVTPASTSDLSMTLAVVQN